MPSREDEWRRLLPRQNPVRGPSTGINVDDPTKPPPTTLPVETQQPQQKLVGYDVTKEWYQTPTWKRSTSWTPATLGTPDLTGVSDLLSSLSFQKVFEGASGAPLSDDTFWGMPTNRQITAAGSGGGFIWSPDALPEALIPGYKAPQKHITIEQILEDAFRTFRTPVWEDVVPEPAPAPELPPAPPYTGSTGGGQSRDPVARRVQKK